LCAPINNAEARGGGWRQVMAYAFEEGLPLPAEDVVADYLVHDDYALGVCVVVERLVDVVEHLEARGVVIETICPGALLALQREMSTAHSQADIVLWRHGNEYNLFQLQDGHIHGWYLMLHNEEDVVLRLAISALCESASRLRVRVHDVDPSLLLRIEQMEDIEIVETDVDSPVDLDHQAAQMAAEIAADRAEPLVNLRRGALAPADRFRRLRRSATIAIGSLVTFLVVLTVALMISANRYDHQTRLLAIQQQQVFRRVLPNHRSRQEGTIRQLTGEYDRLLAQQGKSEGLDQTVSLFELMASVLKRLPTNVRFQLSEMDLSSNRWSLKGLVRSHQDKAQIAQSLMRDNSLIITNDSATIVSGGVQFNFGVAIASAERFGSSRSNIAVEAEAIGDER